MRLNHSFSLLNQAYCLLQRPSAWLIWVLCLCLCAAPLTVDAAGVSPFKKTKISGPSKKTDTNAPVMLDAQEIGYDREKSLIVARGNVEVVQGEQILFADQISYNQATGVMRADGNVRLLQPDGNVIFAEHTELKNAMKQGVVENLRARMLDDSVFAARTGRRVDQDVTLMKKAVYSPCKLPSCEEAKRSGKAPMWQMRAEKIKVDNIDQKVTYENARMELYGIPVLYTPYLRHPTPDADAEAGFLAPSYSNSTNLGFMVRTPYYVPISPSSELTLTPMYTTKEGPVLSGQYRKLFEKGYMQMIASGTYPEKRDNLGNQIDGQEFRGHVAGYGDYQLDSIWTAGFQLNRATDDTYMRRYRFGNELTLTSRLFVEGIKNRTHAIIQGVTFQGLEVQDDMGQAPYVAPYGSYETESAPGWAGSRWRTEVGTMALARTEGADTRRLTSLVGWRLPVVSGGGHVFEVDTQMRAEAYNMSENNYFNPTISAMDEYSGTLTRVIPQVSMTWRLPMQRPVGSARWVLEPLAGAAISPNGASDPRISNEDSQIVEFTDTNLFSFNRYPGMDEVETGARAYYGVRNQVLFSSGLSVYGLAGQTYQRNTDNAFPYTNEVDSRLSDYVGMLGFQSGWLNGNYRFRLDKEEMEMRRQEANITVNGDFTTLSLDYVNLRPDAYTVSRNELIARAGMQVSEEWRMNGFVRRDLDEARMVDAGGGFQFTNECLHWWIMARREFTRDRDIEPNTSITTQVFFKNIN